MTQIPVGLDAQFRRMHRNYGRLTKISACSTTKSVRASACTMIEGCSNNELESHYFWMAV